MKTTLNLLVKAGLLALLMVSATVTAQDAAGLDRGNEEQQTVRALYNSHSKAQYAVQFDATYTNIQSLRPRLNRFWYLLLHADHNHLVNAPARLQLGFFRTQAEARQFIDEYQGVVRGMRVVPVSASDYQAIFRPPERADRQDWYWLSPADPAAQVSMQSLLDQAKDHYIDNDFERASRFYAALSLTSDTRTSLWARELLGLSHERLGDHPQAVRIYQQILREAPDSSVAPRIAQRLRAVETATSDGQDALRRSSFDGRPKKPLLRGVIGQSYRYMTRDVRNRPEEDVLSLVATHFDIYANKTLGAHAMQARINGYHLYDEMDSGRDTRSNLRQLHLNYRHSGNGLDITGGRQRDFRSGVFSSFDGVTIKYPVLEKLTMGVSIGEPVLFADVYDELDRRFFSIHAVYDFGQHWKATGYYTEQTLFNETDRSALGADIRYTAESLTGYFNVDYDYEFAEFNNLLLGSTYRFENRSTVSASYGRQRTPFLTATNVLLGQPFLDVQSYLQNDINRENLLYRALLRTSSSEFGTFNYHRKLDENLDLSIDVYQSVMSDIPIFTTEPGEQSFVLNNDAEYRYTTGGIQLIANNFLGFNDIASLSLRTSDSTESSSNWLQISERLRFFNNKFFITPKVYLGYTQRKSNQHTQSRVRASLAAKYKPFRNTELFIEVGNEAFNDLELRHRIGTQYLFAGYSVRF